MPSIVTQSPEIVHVIQHPIKGGWSLVIEGEPSSECFCHWPEEALGAAVTYASQHFARVVVPPPPAPAPLIGKALRALQSMFNQNRS